MASSDAEIQVTFDINDLYMQQEGLINQIETYRKNYKKRSLDTRTKGYIQGRQEGIRECWRQFCANHGLIFANATAADKKHAYFLQDKFSSTEEFYSNFRGELNDALGEFNTSMPTGAPLSPSPLNSTQIQAEKRTAKPEVKMPRINIPTFSGSYKSWRSFRDLFVSLIHHSEIPTVQKMYFLKTSLEGEAARLIQHLDITDDNYEASWNIITQRFENKRIIINTYLNCLMAQPIIRTETHESIKQLLDTTQEALHALESFSIDISTWDSILIYVLTHKLPQETRELWETSLGNRLELPTFQELCTFLENRFRTLEMIKEHTRSTSIVESRNKFHTQPRGRNAFLLREIGSCTLCKGPHPVRQCFKFLKLSVPSRSEFASRHSLCQNCLASSHPTQGCTSPRTCYHCGQRHHTLLHDASINLTRASPHTFQTNDRRMLSEQITVDNTTQQATRHQQPPQPSNTTTTEQNVVALHTNKNASCMDCLLATAIISVPTDTGTHTLRALIDQGSQGSFITEDAVQRLHLKRTRAWTHIKGINPSESNTSISTRQVTFNLRSRWRDNFCLEVSASVLKTITNYLPSKTIPFSPDWHHLENLPLADPNFTIPNKIDVLLGVDVYAAILLDGILKGPTQSPTAQNTYLGWILFGKINNGENQDMSATSSMVINSFHSCVETEQLLQRFWEIEEVIEPRRLTNEELKCEQLYERTVKREPNGRYIVHLPFKETQPPILGNSRNLAIRRLKSIERKLSANLEIYHEYNKCLQEYLDLGHMRPSPTAEHQHLTTNTRGRIGYTLNYLPHHAVFKESTTTQLRVVFDASACTSNGQSLNDTLLVGPKLQEDLVNIILRWRKYKVAFTADITKMYRQIKVTEDHTPYQRIVWRPHPNEEVKDYDLLTVTFGTAAAPYLAMKTIKQVAHDERERYPLAYPVALHDFYVDDLMSGTYDVETALQTQLQLNEMLSTGGFQLRKWACNYPNLVNHLPEDRKEHKHPLSIELDHAVKTLGLCWYPIQDVFSFKISELQYAHNVSKRLMLSEIARLFDPIGWLTPCIITAKILMQQLWLTGIAWDDIVPFEVSEEWNKLKKDLHLLNELRIPRWIGLTQNSATVEIHGFCDASTKAYCAVLYTRVMHQFGPIQISLLTAKSKVAPVKPVTLPRLELCAAVLLAKLLNSVCKSMQLETCNIYAWTDSTITLSWIHEKPSKWKTFVCNRVSVIQEKTKVSCWHHISTKDNPADCGSRGLSPSQLLNHSLWWKGPVWLQQSTDHWPKIYNTYKTTEEQRTIHVLTTQRSDQINLITKYSKLSTLVKVVAWCFRFAHNCKLPKASRVYNWLNPKEIWQARIWCIKWVQSEVYNHEITQLQNNHRLHTKGPLLSLNPFLSDDGLLRVGGRLQHSTLKYNEKHPIILPNHHHLTRLIVSEAVILHFMEGHNSCWRI